MKSGCRALAAYRSLAIRPRPVALRSCPIVLSRRGDRPFSDGGKAPSPPPIDSPKSNGAAIEPADGVSKSREPSSPFLDTANSAVEGESVAQTAPDDALGDEALEQILYGGRSVLSDRGEGLTSAQEEVLFRDGMIPPARAAEALLASQSSLVPARTESSIGHKWPLPQRPFPDDYHHRQRYHPVLHQISRLLMRDGKLSVAQKNLAMVMNHLRTSPAPIYSPKFPLLPGSPPSSHLPLNPVLYLTIAIDSVAPIIRINRIAGGAGGGRALDMPTPIAVRARRRQAFQWIMESVNNKPSRGSGPRQLPVRIAEEIIAVVEGRSSVWDKRKLVHKVGTAARGNIGKAVRVKKSMGR